jgi:hypothetical protein
MSTVSEREFLMFWGIPLSLSVIFWGIGMVDCWHSGIMAIKIGNNRIFVFLPTPPFESSSWGNAPEFLYNQQVTRILSIKDNELQTKITLTVGLSYSYSGGHEGLATEKEIMRLGWVRGR